jgi:NhaA family Na+:H+ antiporter
LFSASWLAGIGFTMSLFIASSAFDSPELLSVSKVAILAASLLASAIGFALVSLTSPSQEGVSSLEEAPSPA